jgi:HTH-type transcriptional regulator / antitoxin HigA
MSTTNYAVPTGSFIDEWLEENQMTRAELARRLGVSRKHISQLVAGKVPLSYGLADDLEIVTGVSARVWNSYEAQYQADVARLRKDKVLAARFDEAGCFPLEYLRKRGCIRASRTNRAAVVRELLEFFGIADFDSLLAYAPLRLAAYRQSQAYEIDKYAVASWIQYGLREAEDRKVEDFKTDSLKEALPLLRSLTVADDFGHRIVDILAAAGVVVVFDAGPPGTRCSGVTHWIDETPIVQLTDRGKKNDRFWFTLFHELGHVLLHSRHRVFVEGGSRGGEVDQAELDADMFARDTLIAPSDWARRPTTNAIAGISQYASSIGIHPGVVVGRIQHETGNYNWGNGLKQTVRISED